MKAIKLQSPGKIVLTEMPVPVRGKGMALIKVKAAGICGSDVNAYRGANPLISYPRIIGHELAGEIAEVDADDPNGWKPGDRVVADPYLYCGKCYPCSIGRTNCCENLQVLGVQTDGGMAEYFVHPARMLVPIPAGIPWTLAPMAEPLTISLHALHRGKLQAGMHMAIIGAGAIGLMAALAAQAYGAEPILIDVVQERLDFANKLGVTCTLNSRTQDVCREISNITKGRMAEVVLEASGANPAIRQTLDIVAHAGTVVLTGWPKMETTLPTDLITKKEIDVCGSRTSAGEFEEALRLIEHTKVDAAAVLSKVVPMTQVPAVVQELSEHPERYLKVNVSFE